MKVTKLALVGCGLILALMIALMGSSTPSLAQSTQDPCRDAEGNEICPHYNSFDDRVNYLDPLASMAGFCRPNGSFDVWIVTNDRGQYVFTVQAGQLSDGLGRALATGQPVQIAAASGMEVWALPSNQLMMRDARNGYEFAFSPALCRVVPAANPGTTKAGGVKSGTGKPGSAQTTRGAAAGDVTYVAEVQSTALLNLRALPSSRAELLATLPTGSTLKVVGRTRDNQWLKVGYEGQIGWVATAYTSILNRVLFRLPVVAP
jgi:hypothetical protein